ncbi:MAG: tyrosine-type recombinase/integrase [Daejeonella sp.]
MFLERFIKYLQFEKRFSAHTVTAYKKDLRQFQVFLEKKKESKDCSYQVPIPLDYSSALPIHIRKWMISLLDEGKEAKTINRKISSLRSFYKFLEREQLIFKNPMLQIKAPKIPKRLPVVVEETKMNSLLDSKNIFTEDFSGIRNRLIIELLYGTGMRLSELITLKDLDINIYEQNLKVFGKRNKERIIPINTSLLNLIKNYLNEKKDQTFNTISDTLIVTNEGKNAYPKFIYRIVRTCLSYISTHDKKSPHILRHTFATSLLNNGADLNAIKELLGHASLAATQVYTHNSVERLKSIYKQAHPKA